MGLITIHFINKINSKHRNTFNYPTNNGEIAVAERNVKLTDQQTDDDSMTVVADWLVGISYDNV